MPQPEYKLHQERLDISVLSPTHRFVWELDGKLPWELSYRKAGVWEEDLEECTEKEEENHKLNLMPKHALMEFYEDGGEEDELPMRFQAGQRRSRVQQTLPP